MFSQGLAFIELHGIKDKESSRVKWRALSYKIRPLSLNHDFIYISSKFAFS